MLLEPDLGLLYVYGILQLYDMNIDCDVTFLLDNISLLDTFKVFFVDTHTKQLEKKFTKFHNIQCEVRFTISMSMLKAIRGWEDYELCCYKIRGDLSKPPIDVEMIFDLVFDIEFSLA